MNLIQKHNKLILADCREETDHQSDITCFNRTALLLETNNFQKTATIGVYNSCDHMYSHTCDKELKELSSCSTKTFIALKEGIIELVVYDHPIGDRSKIKLDADEIHLKGIIRNQHLEDKINTLIEDNKKLNLKVQQLEEQISKLL